MSAGYVDTHCHLVSKHFESDAVEVAEAPMLSISVRGTARLPRNDL